MKAKDTSWKSMARLMLMNVYNPEKQNIHKIRRLLLTADKVLWSINCVPNVSYLWRSPRETLHMIYKLNVVFDSEQGGAD